LSTSEIVKRTPMQRVLAEVASDGFIAKLSNALPEGMPVQRFVSITVSAIKQNPELIAADHDSLYNAIIRCAQDGLMPDAREAAFVIFKGKAVYMPMIGGFRKIAAENGWSIDTQCVYENDQFAYKLGAKPALEHMPAPLGTPRGKLIGAYAVCTHKDGRKQIEVMGRDEIEKVRAVSRSKDKGPWVDWYERQAEKTVGRRAFVKLPLSGPALERAARVIDANDDDYELEAPQESMSEAEANLLSTARNLPRVHDEDTVLRDEPSAVQRPNDAQLNRLAGLAAAYEGDVTPYLVGAFGVDSFEELTPEQAAHAEVALARLVSSQAEDAGEGEYEEPNPFHDLPTQTDEEPEQATFEDMVPESVKRQRRRS